MTHPTFPELARAVTKPQDEHHDVMVHVAACPLCQQTMASIRGDEGGTTFTVTVTSAERETPRNLREGQVWRLEWEGAVAFGAIVRAHENQVEVLPITEDPELIQDPIQVWTHEDSPVGFSAALWRGPVMSVPTFVLDRYYSMVSIPHLPPQPIAPISSSDASYALIVQTVNTFQTLSSVSWLARSAGEDWDSLLAKADLSYSQLAAELEMTSSELGLLRQGRTDLTREQQERLMTLLEIEQHELPNATLPRSGLVWALNRPVVRQKIRTRASEWGEDEATTRQRVAYALAASYQRSTQDRESSEFWEQVVDDYFNW